MGRLRPFVLGVFCCGIAVLLVGALVLHNARGFPAESPAGSHRSDQPAGSHRSDQGVPQYPNPEPAGRRVSGSRGKLLVHVNPIRGSYHGLLIATSAVWFGTSPLHAASRSRRMMKAKRAQLGEVWDVGKSIFGHRDHARGSGGISPTSGTAAQARI